MMTTGMTMTTMITKMKRIQKKKLRKRLIDSRVEYKCWDAICKCVL